MSGLTSLDSRVPLGTYLYQVSGASRRKTHLGLRCQLVYKRERGRKPHIGKGPCSVAVSLQRACFSWVLVSDTV